MFPINDIAALGAKLFVPFFATAFVADRFLNEIANELPEGNEPAALILRFVILAVLLYFAFVSIINPFVVWLDSFLPETDMISIMLSIGFICVAIGIYGMSLVFHLPKSPLNLFWPLGFLSYGFSLINRSGKVLR